MIEEPSINAVYRVVRPQSTYLLERQSKLAPRYLTSQTFAEMYNRQVDLFADEFNYLLPEERLVFPTEDTSLIEGYYWRYLPVNERECYFKGMSRWSMLVGGYMDGRLHKFLLLEAASGMYYWGRVNRGVFSRVSRLRVNEKDELKDLSVAFARPVSNEIPVQLASQISFWISSGSPFLDLIDCAAGRLDMFITPATSEIFPVLLTVMQESGGLVCDLNGEILSSPYDMIAEDIQDTAPDFSDSDDITTDSQNPTELSEEVEQELVIAGNPAIIHAYRNLVADRRD